MIKKATKVVSIALCATMMMSLMACNTGKTTTTPTTSPTSSASSSASIAVDPFGKYDTTIKLTTVRSLDATVKFDTTKPTEKSLTENIWASTYKDSLNVEFEYLWTPNGTEYDSRWNTAIASNSIPDCGVVSTKIYKELIDAGLVEDMTKYYKDYGSDLYKSSTDGDGGLTMSFMTFDEKLMGLPLPGITPDNVNLIFIRKDWLKKVNMTEPTTVDQLVDVARAFVKAKLGGKDTYGICFSKGIDDGQNNLQGFMNSFGAYSNIWIKDSGTNSLVYSTIQPAMKNTLLKLQEMYKEGLISQDFAVKDSSTAGQDVAAGKVGITYGTYWAPLGSMADSIKSDTSADWEVLIPPTSDGSKYTTQASATPWEYIFVKKGIEHPEAVVKVMNINFKMKDLPAYGTQEDGIELFKYKFASSAGTPWSRNVTYLACANAISKNDTSALSSSDKSVYDMIIAASKGDRNQIPYDLVFGLNSTYKYINELKTSNQILIDADQTMPTATQTSAGDTLRISLEAAMLKVIMGDAISTWDSATAAWKNGGGDKMTSEINAWYSKK